MTKFQQAMKKRNVAIACGRRQGMTLRGLAAAFDLSPARVVKILADLRDGVEMESEHRRIYSSADVLRN